MGAGRKGTGADKKLELHQQYISAVCAYSDAAAVVAQKLTARQLPTAAELEREEAARALLDAARRAYFELLNGH